MMGVAKGKDGQTNGRAKSRTEPCSACPLTADNVRARQGPKGGRSKVPKSEVVVLMGRRPSRSLVMVTMPMINVGGRAERSGG